MSKDGTTIIEKDGSPKLIPHGLFDIMKIVWTYHSMEQRGVEFPGDFFTPDDMLKYSTTGILESLKSGLIAILFTPIAFGVISAIVPIFGESDPSHFDKMFAFILALSLTIAYAFVLISITQRYIFPFTKKIIKNFLQGVIAGKILITIVAFIFYHWMYIKVLTEDNVIAASSRLHSFVSYDKLNSIYLWIMDFRPVLLTSAWFIVLTTVIFISIPLISIVITVRKNKQLTEEDL
jgi:hypothetical protein